MSNSTSNNHFNQKNNTANTRVGGSTALYEESQNMDSINIKNNIYYNNSNNNNKNKFNYDSKQKNILAAIDINKNYYEKKRPYSANKMIYYDRQQASNNSKASINFKKPRSAKSKIKNHDNSDLGNYQELKNVNADYYQALIDKITQEYGNVDAELIHDYIKNLENENKNNVKIINENNEFGDDNNNNNHLQGNDIHYNNYKGLNNNQEISEINNKNNSQALQNKEDIEDENYDNFYNQDFENN